MLEFIFIPQSKVFHSSLLAHQIVWFPKVLWRYFSL